MTEMATLAKDLQLGDLVDLESDMYADPGHSHTEYEFEYSRVSGIQWEGNSTVVIEFNNACVAFPPEHKLYIKFD